MADIFCFFLHILHGYHVTSSSTKTRKKTDEEGSGCRISHTLHPYPTLYIRILHPILHPKSSVNTGHPVPWCRKCRRFSKTFFVEGRARRWSGSSKTSDFFDTKYGCFASKVRMFASKKPDVLLLPERVVYIRAVSHESFREHRHHVRKHIINKAFFILVT